MIIHRMKLRWYVVCSLLAAISLGIQRSACADTLRVNSASTNAAPDGLTWETAFPALGDALAKAKKGDEIWVAAGTYTGSFTVTDGVALLGGFGGTETVRDQRDILMHASILDGQRRTNVLVVASGAGPETRIDGFTIRNGVSASGTPGTGGGIRAIGAEPVIANNSFISNAVSVAGSAVYLHSSSATLVSNYFGFNGYDTFSPGEGGAVAVFNSSPRIESNTFVGNRGRDGGAVYISTSTGYLIGNSMLNNSATRDGGALLCTGASPQMDHNRMLANVAAARGGGAAFLSGSASLFFNNVLCMNVAATSASETRGGGGVFIDSTSQPSVLNNTLVSNTAPVGGILVSNRNSLIANNIVAFGTSGVGGVSNPRLQFNDLFGNTTGNYVGITDQTGTAGNVSVDPKFAGDLRLAVVNLLPDSPCKDAGSSQLVPFGATDIDGKPRIQGAAVDIGAAESDGVTTTFLPPVVRVAPEGDDHNDGGAWNRAKKSIQAAVDVAGRTGGEVWVKTGSYTENVIQRSFTYLYAGFAGAETNRSERNFRTNTTVIDGRQSGTVVRMAGLDDGETVDGFTIVNGAAPAGGGVYADGNVRIVNNRFENNTAIEPATTTLVRGGGAIYLGAGNALVGNNFFLRNRTAVNSTNMTADGGAIVVVAGAPSVINNVFRGNSVTNAFPKGLARGGALLVLSSARPNIINNTFTQNSAQLSNGASLPDQGGAVNLVVATSGTTPVPVLVNNLIAYNSTGVSATGRTPDVRNNLVYGSARANYDRIADQTGTNGNISLPPRLVGPYGDPHISSNSPARDAGDSSVVGADWTDLDGLPRISGTRVDIGADEFDGTEVVVPDRVFFVREDGDDAKSGTSWANARKTVGSALASASVEGGEVWVKAGTYRERVRVELFTYLLGGFNGTETSRSARDWAVNQTIIDGAADAVNPVPENSVVSVVGTDGFASVDGLTIQNGAARLGGGVNIFGSALVANNLIRSNIALTAVTNSSPSGAGIYCNSGSPTIVNNVIVGNTVKLSAGTGGRGGGMYFDCPAGSNPYLLNNTVISNRASTDGGGIYITAQSGLRVVGNIIAFNSHGINSLNTTNVAVACCAFGNGVYNYSGIKLGPGSTVADPLFVDWRNGNYRLRADSPCLDVAVADPALGTLDFYGSQRVVNGLPDVGATEFPGATSPDYDLSIVQPINGSVFVSPATIFLSVSITGGTSRPAYVEYYVDDVLAVTALPDGYSSFAQNVLAGQHTIAAKAVNATGAVKTSAPITINVVVPPNNVRPVVNITSPTSGQVVPFNTDLLVKFSWTKPGGRVTRWDVFTNNVLAAQNLSVPSGTTNGTATLNDLQTGDYLLTVVATDNLGDKGTNSVNFSVALTDPDPSTIHSPVLLGNGTMQLEFTAPTAGASYITESSVDYSKWIPISTNSGGGTVKIIVPVDPLKKIEVFRTRAGF